MFTVDRASSSKAYGACEETELLDFVEEECMPDRRFNLRPSEVVQSKLLDVLPRGAAVPVSCMHDRRPVRR